MPSDTPAEDEAKKANDDAPSVDERNDAEGGLEGTGSVSAAEDEKVDPINDADAPIAADIEEPTSLLKWLPLALAIIGPALFFFVLPPLTRSGLWDPYELNVADLARRIALNLHQAGDLALTGADNSLPHLNDLGRPQLPFTSIALGFKMFGLHEWAGRAPLAAWGVLGVLATYGFVARLVDRRAALYSAIALTTMPLYFVQARTMLGDIVTMSAFAMAFGGLAVAVFDRRDDDTVASAIVPRVLWLLVAFVGLAAGFGSRGGLLGVAVPLVAIGCAWGLSWSSGTRRFDAIGDATGALSLLAGVALSVACVNALQAEKQTNLNLLIGAMVKAPSKYPTFDYYVGHLGPALAPWSAFAPFAMGRLFIAPIGKHGSAFRRETFTRMALLVGAAVAFGAHGYLASHTDLIAFCAPACIAAICGIAIRDFERGAHASVAVGVGTCVFLGLFHHDFHELPEKAYQAFAVAATTFPESFKDHALLLWTLALVGFAGVAFLTWIERNSARQPFAPKNYVAMAHALREAWDGLLVLSYFALVAGASLAGLGLWLGAKTHAKWLPTLSLQLRDGVLNAWWITAFVPPLIIFGTYFASDVWLWTFGRARRFSTASLTRGFEPFEELYATVAGQSQKEATTREERITAALILVPLMVLAAPGAILAVAIPHGMRVGVAVALAIPSGIFIFVALGIVGDLLRGRRATFLALSGALVGGLLCFSYYPALANQLSPKEVFETYQRTAHHDEPLALFGVGSRTAAYYIGGQPTEFKAVQPAFQWLTGSGEGSRRFLAMKSDELSKLNEMYRERATPRTNLPVLDARSSQIMLVSSTLASGEKNENPLNKIILAAPPKPQHKLDVDMEGKLAVLGYDLTDEQGRLIDSVAPGRKYRMRTYYKVLAPVTTEWEAFIHIDGYHRRHNGDHKPMDGKYPFSLWLPGDLMVDDYEFNLEPNFTPGSYTVYFGLFVGETRLKVTSGPSDGENRINGGQLRVQ